MRSGLPSGPAAKFCGRTTTVAGEEVATDLTRKAMEPQKHCRDAEANEELEVQAKEPMIEWLANEYKKFGCALEFVSDKSTEGSQFCKGFSGIGGLLRYAVNLEDFQLDEQNDFQDFYASDDDW